MNSPIQKREIESLGHGNGFEVSRFNALKHGVLSAYTILPWEDEEEYRGLLDALVAEHQPHGPTEEHLVEELAGILWRKRRLRLAEGAAYRRGLENAAASHRETVKAALIHLDPSQQIERVVDAVQATPESTAEELAELERDEAKTERALEILRDGKADAYERALKAVREDTRDWWHQKSTPKPRDPLAFNLDHWEMDDEEPYSPNAVGLRDFLETEVTSWYETRRKELQNRPLIKSQAFGEALDPDRLDKLARYEVHLDRKLERTLAMLIKLQDLRRETALA